MLLHYRSVILHSKTSLQSELLLTLKGPFSNYDLQSHQNYGNAYFIQNCNYEQICCRKIYWQNKDYKDLSVVCPSAAIKFSSQRDPCGMKK